jgi:type II secretory pathway pseudopilin PulG
VDFVVVGLGLGAAGILCGVVMLGWLAGRGERAAARAATAADRAYEAAMAAARRETGRALLGAGCAVLIATIAALAGSLDDRTGAYFVTTTVTVAALGLLLWGYLYHSRHPVPPRRRTRAAAAVAPAATERRSRLPTLTDNGAPVLARNGAHDPAVEPALANGALAHVVPLDRAPLAETDSDADGEPEAAAGATESDHGDEADEAPEMGQPRAVALTTAAVGGDSPAPEASDKDEGSS